MSHQFLLHVKIEIIKGGFVLEYPVLDVVPDVGTSARLVREVFTSTHKMHQKLKEVITALSTTITE